MGELHEDVYFGDINQRVNELASLAPENWNVGGRTDNSVLKNYLKYTYKKLEEEGKIIQEVAYCLFNTGLFTEYYEPIYAYLEPNVAGGTQPYYLKSFQRRMSLGRWESVNYLREPIILNNQNY